MGHRLAPLLPVGAILAGVGVYWATLLVQRWSRRARWVPLALAAALFGYTGMVLASSSQFNANGGEWGVLPAP